MINPYPYSLDNKRYQTWNYYGKTRFGKKIVKVPLDAGFTCPNRDGTKGYGGCAFCPSNGINNFPVPRADDLLSQFKSRAEVLRKKWPDGIYAPYFQSYSNTYAKPEILRGIYAPFAQNPDFPMVFLATRCDCLSEEVLDLLEEMFKGQELWIEIGVQSSYNETLHAMRCGYTFENVRDAVRRIKERHFRVSVHLINGLPGETIDMMIENARKIARLGADAVKFHALLILKDAALEKEHAENPVPLLTLEDYARIVSSQLEVLPAQMIVERIVSDAPEDELIAPDWVIKKTVALNTIDRVLSEQNTYQGRLYVPSMHY
ncbi:MAG: TIGR01212 family radical SAM protein [Erysipelotrichales bacterium]|nr:TIGR01212 family radical SAM protein [Erysipelotrichales bacterium]